MSLCDAKMPKNQDNLTISRHSCEHHNERGSVIVWILVMVALLGALYFTFSSGFRSGEANLSREKVDLYATEILDYAQSIKQAVHTLQINGCADTEISFNQNIINGYSNPNSPTDNSCDVFHPSGGGINLAILNSNYLDQSESAQTGFNEPFFSQQMRVPEVGTDCGPGTCQELTFFVPFINYDVCLKINDKIGNSAVVEKDSTAAIFYNDGNKFDGVYDGNSVLNGTPSLLGKHNGCFEGDAQPPGGYHFYQVLSIR